MMFLSSIFCMNVLFFETVISHSEEVQVLLEPSYCAIDEYFDVIKLKCISCDSEKNLIPSDDGLMCICNERCKVISAYGASPPVCEPCADNMIPTSDKRDCISCPAENLVTRGNETLCQSFECPPNSAHLERWPDGSVRDRVACVKCKNHTRVSPATSTCLPCDNTLMSEEGKKCSCSPGERPVGDFCVLAALLSDWPEEADTFSVLFENGRKLRSQFLSDHLLRAVSLCKMNNPKYCQMAANICVMTLYSSEGKSSPCSLFKEHRRIPVANSDSLPWIYYGEGEASAVLNRKRISARYNLDANSEMSFLNLTGIFYKPDGSFKGIKPVSGSMLQLCPGSWKSLDTSLRFASKYSFSCDILAQQLLHNRELEFIDLFLHYKDAEGDILYAIPVLIKNMKVDGSYNNVGPDNLQWQFVRRFFLIDKVLGVRYDEESKWRGDALPEVVRYVKSAKLNIRLQGSEDEGRIFVPFLVLDYAELTREQIDKNILISLKFEVDYEMENSLTRALEISIGLFSALAVVWSSIKTWSHSRRSGRVTIDLVTLAHLLLFTCGNLANVFFLIVFCTSLNIFIFFKGQSAIHVLLPKETQEETIKTYIIVAFLLKIVEICYLMYYQITIDIFFIDWERPRARNLVPRTVSAGSPNSEIEEQQQQQPVSIWRTYFVANEWNEIQTQRKLNINIHLLITVLILKCFGVEHWTTTDPELIFEKNLDSVGKSPCFICHFAVGGLVFIATYFIQWLFMMVIYERYVKNGIQEFVDICSVANISVFILALENYGFYIHGRSVHGFADTDMQNILNQLHREEEDLVGHRGLLPGTDQQTFEIIVPNQLRSYYRRVMIPLKNIGQSVKRLTSNQGNGPRMKLGMDNVDRSIQAYHNMNRFLAAFLEHALKDLDYEVREKMFTEALLGIEFLEFSDKGVLYSDNGHSFDNVLFYGNEFSLLTFDIMLFCFVDVVAQDYLIAGILTAAVDHLMAMVRNVGGRKNLAKKTLIDERFLI